jgi:MarR family transcriptional regulator, transcriptional regulator for hemolysin
MGDHESSCAFLIHDTTRLIRKRLDAAIRGLELTPTKWRLLTALKRHPGISQSLLAELLDIEKAPIGLAVESLQKAGWIRREEAPGDRRVRRVFLEERAQETLLQLEERARAIESNYLRGFDGEEIAQLLDCLRMIKSELRGKAAAASEHEYSEIESDVGSVPESEACFGLLFECARLLTRRFDAPLAALGYTRNQWLVLNTVFRGEGMRQSEIATTTEMGAAPVGKIVDALESAGWLERRSDADDRRAKRLYLTRRAKHMLQGMRVRFEQLHESLARPLGEARTRMLVNRLGWIRHRLLEESSSIAEKRSAAPKPSSETLTLPLPADHTTDTAASDN